MTKITRNSIEKRLKPLPHKLVVSFALYCAKDCYPLIKDKKLKDKAKLCTDLVTDWLNGKSVTNKELIDAAYAAYAAYNVAYTAAADAAAYAAAAYAAYAAYAAASAAAVYAAYAADAAAYADAANAAADAAAYAAYADADATTYADAAYAANLNKLKEYDEYLTTMLKSLSLIERLILKADV